MGINGDIIKHNNDISAEVKLKKYRLRWLYWPHSRSSCLELCNFNIVLMSDLNSERLNENVGG